MCDSPALSEVHVVAEVICTGAATIADDAVPLPIWPLVSAPQQNALPPWMPHVWESPLLTALHVLPVPICFGLVTLAVVVVKSPRLPVASEPQHHRYPDLVPHVWDLPALTDVQPCEMLAALWTSPVGVPLPNCPLESDPQQYNFVYGTRIAHVWEPPALTEEWS